MFSYKTVFLLIAIYLSSIGSAHSLDKYDIVIPAAACTPKSSDDAKKIELSNLSWIFTGASVGTVTLLCPVPISFPNDERPNVYKVYYTDPDGRENRVNGPGPLHNAIIRTDFDVSIELFRLKPSSGSSDTIISSSLYSVERVPDTKWSSSVSGPGAPARNTKSAFVYINDQNELNSLFITPIMYTFEVQIRRGFPMGTPSFSGISFVEEDGFPRG